MKGNFIKSIMLLNVLRDNVWLLLERFSSFRTRCSWRRLASKLDGYRNEETYEEEGYNLQLLTEITGLLPKGNTLTGIYSHDYVMHVFHRGKVVPLPRTVEAIFSFARTERTTFLALLRRSAWQTLLRTN